MRWFPEKHPVLIPLRLLALASIGAFLGHYFGVYFVVNFYLYDHGYGETAKTQCIIGIYGVIAGCVIHLLWSLKDRKR